MYYLPPDFSTKLVHRISKPPLPHDEFICCTRLIPDIIGHKKVGSLGCYNDSANPSFGALSVIRYGMPASVSSDHTHWRHHHPVPQLHTLNRNRL
jgi:hypothetical protein